jgi:hypothetical protein
MPTLSFPAATQFVWQFACFWFQTIGFLWTDVPQWNDAGILVARIELLGIQKTTGTTKEAKETL